MDPIACYKRYLDADIGDDVHEKEGAAEDLIDWIMGGGFEPNWNTEDRADFAAYSVFHNLEGAREFARTKPNSERIAP